MPDPLRELTDGGSHTVLHRVPTETIFLKCVNRVSVRVTTPNKPHPTARRGGVVVFAVLPLKAIIMCAVNSTQESTSAILLPLKRMLKDSTPETVIGEDLVRFRVKSGSTTEDFRHGSRFTPHNFS